MDNDGDFESVEGLVEYVAGYVTEQIRGTVKKYQDLPTMGVVLAKKATEEQAEPVKPVWIGYAGIKKPKSLLRDAVKKMHAVGVIYVEQEDREVIVRMEHAQFGDLQWRASFGRLKLGESMHGPTIPEEVTRFLPRRYMN